MKKQFLFLSFILSLFLLLQNSCGVEDYASEAPPASHILWDSLLQQHVSDEGWVNYKGFIQDSSLFTQYLEELEGHHPNEKWSREEKMAYWINVYNAYTVKMIIDHYPTKSIKSIKKGIPFINSVWDIKFIHIEGATYDLNNVEHGILREKFNDPRIHFAINCASVSCPRLNNHAYFAETLDKQLDIAARAFFEDETKNIIRKKKVQLSKILKWFHGDFKNKEENFITFLNTYSPVEIDKNAKVEYLDYDWGLNEQ